VIDLLVWIGVLVLGLILTGIAIAGVWESLALVACLTVIELGGLVLDMWAGFSAPMVAEFANPPPIPWIGLAFGAVLAFFAFIGFEDIVNMAEEVHRPQRSLSLAIMAALAITIVIYAAISWATLRSVPASDLAASEAPLVLVWQAGTGQSPQFLSLIAVAAALNGILALIVMVARVLFGLGKRSPALAPLRRVNLRFGTPVTATLFVGAFLTLAALILPVVTLASSTAVILLTVFALVNLSLLPIKRRGVPHSGFTVPIWVPCLGLVLAMVALMASLLGILGWS
ncbi:MAG: amino acid permease, partial [Rhodobacteraceae bacterium]|nr:amino acid permease [Paracoccaceae bacterium]